MYVSIAERVGEKRGMERGMERGKLEGKREGERAKALETARKMLSRNMLIADISEITGLTEDEIRSLMS